MLRLFQRYRNTVLGTVLVIILSLSMLSFGVNFSDRGKRRHAIRINDREISFDEFYRARNELEQRYRSAFGANYPAVAEQLRVQLNQETADALIQEAILEQMGDNLGLVVPPEEVVEKIKEFFPADTFSAENYAKFLSRMRLTAKSFEEKIRAQLLQQQFWTLLDTVIPSRAEVEAVIRREKTTYDVIYAQLDPKEFRSMVVPPDEATLERLYAAQSSAYQAPARVAFSYFVIEPTTFPGLVPVSDEEIELFYLENRAKFTIPARVSVSYLLVPAGDSNRGNEVSPQDELSKARQEARDFSQRLKKGESLAAVAIERKLSAPIRQSEVVQEDLPAPLRAPVFSAVEPFEPLVVEDSKGAYVVVIEGRKPEKVKPIEEVRDSIRHALITENASPFVAAKADELFQEWLRSGLSLSEYGGRNTLAIQQAQLREAEDEVDSSNDRLKGLVRYVLANPSEKKQRIDLDQVSVLVEVTDYREPTLLPLSEVKDRVLASHLDSESRALARAKAESLVAETSQGKSLIDVAEQLGVKTEVERGLSLVSDRDLKPPFSETVVQNEIATLHEPGCTSRAPVLVGESFYVFSIAGRKEPSSGEISQAVNTYRPRSAALAVERLAASLLSREKARADKFVDASILATD